MAEPYGLMFGLGQGLSSVPKAYMEGQAYKTQQDMANTQLEMNQRRLAEDKALSEMWQQPVAEQEFLTPEHQQAATYRQAADYLAANKLGGERQMVLRQKAQELEGLGKTGLAQKAGKSILMGDFKTANDLLAKSGWSFGNVEPDPTDANFVVFSATAPGQKPRRMGVDELSAFVSLPGPQAFNYLSQSEGRMMREQASAASLKSRERIAELNNKTKMDLAAANAKARMELYAKRQGITGDKATARMRDAEAFARNLMATGEAGNWEEAYKMGLEKYAPGAGSLALLEAKGEDKTLDYILKLIAAKGAGADESDPLMVEAVRRIGVKMAPKEKKQAPAPTPQSAPDQKTAENNIRTSYNQLYPKDPTKARLEGDKAVAAFRAKHNLR